MFTSLVDYLQAGLDESLTKFVKGLFASMLMAGGLYIFHHITAQTLTILTTVLSMGIGTPALIALWHWVKTTAEPVAPTVAPDGSVIVA